MQRHQPANESVVDSCAMIPSSARSLRALPRSRHRFDSPPNQRDLRIRCDPNQLRRGHRSRNPRFLTHALFHHCAALGGVRVFVADQHAIFIVLVARHHVRVPGHAGNHARRHATFGDQVERLYSSCVSLKPFEVISSPRSTCGLKFSTFGSTLSLPSASSRSQRTIPGH